MQKTPCLTLLLVLITVSLISCSKKEKEISGMNVSGIRTTISRILISPLAFDGAIVAIEGLATDVRKEPSNGGGATLFKLSDLKGNYINVSASGTWEILENDLLVVGGIYRRTENKIEAEQIEKIQLKENEGK